MLFPAYQLLVFFFKKNNAKDKKIWTNMHNFNTSLLRLKPRYVFRQIFRDSQFKNGGQIHAMRDHSFYNLCTMSTISLAI